VPPQVTVLFAVSHPRVVVISVMSSSSPSSSPDAEAHATDERSGPVAEQTGEVEVHKTAQLEALLQSSAPLNVLTLYTGEYDPAVLGRVLSARRVLRLRFAEQFTHVPGPELPSAPGAEFVVTALLVVLDEVKAPASAAHGPSMIWSFPALVNLNFCIFNDLDNPSASRARHICRRSPSTPVLLTRRLLRCSRPSSNSSARL
jgi:hypothetical protein